MRTSNDAGFKNMGQSTNVVFDSVALAPTSVFVPENFQLNSDIFRQRLVNQIPQQQRLRSSYVVNLHGTSVAL
jgi:hypothetical protein